MTKYIEDPKELREWMETYHSSWLKTRNHLIDIITILREGVEDSDKVLKIKEIIDLAFPKNKE